MKQVSNSPDSVLLKVFLGGEGNNELGTRAADFPVPEHAQVPGVLETIARKVQPEGWCVGGAIRWCKIHKYQAKGQLDAEARNVLGLVLQAKEAKCDAVLFARDTDGDLDRQASIEKGIEEAHKRFGDYHRIAGGAPHPMLESWVLSLAGVHGAEKMGKDKLTLEFKKRDIELPKKPTHRYVALTEGANHDRVPPDALSLHTWMQRVRSALAPSP